MAKHESRLVLAIEIARHLQGGDALRAIHENADRGQDVREAHLARSEDRSACHAEMMLAALALVFAARLDEIRVQRAAARACRVTVRFSPAQLAKRLVSLVFAALIHRAQGQGPSFC